MKLPENLKGKPVWLAICFACVSGAEGLRQVAYRDPVGIPTICFGETKGVKLGDRKTPEECTGLLIDRLQEFGDGVRKCVGHDLPPPRKAAYTSLAYNIGVNAFCGSTLVRKERAGNPAGACAEILRWDKAKGVPLPGLKKRRGEEFELCRSSLA